MATVTEAEVETIETTEERGVHEVYRDVVFEYVETNERPSGADMLDILLDCGKSLEDFQGDARRAGARYRLRESVHAADRNEMERGADPAILNRIRTLSASLQNLDHEKGVCRKTMAGYSVGFRKATTAEEWESKLRGAEYQLEQGYLSDIKLDEARELRRRAEGHLRKIDEAHDRFEELSSEYGRVSSEIHELQQSVHDWRCISFR